MHSPAGGEGRRSLVFVGPHFPLPRAPAASAADYGIPFYDIFKRYDGQFYKIDKMLFSPAEVTINNLLTGRVIRRGRVNVDVLQASLGLA